MPYSDNKYLSFMTFYWIAVYIALQNDKCLNHITTKCLTLMAPPLLVLVVAFKNALKLMVTNAVIL